jgi:transposase
LLDATVVKEPGQTGSQWRIHYSLRLPTLECDCFDLTPTQGPNSAERFGRFRFQANELVLADAGYCHPAGIAAVVQQQADVCVRLNPHALPLWEESGEPFSLLKPLTKLRSSGQVAEWPIWVRSGESEISGRVCAIRKSREAIGRAQRRLDIRRQDGKSVGPETRKYAEYVLVFTTLPTSVASTEQILEAYRLRWQVELTFKRLKSIAQIGHVPKHDDQSSRAWLYGKLFVALLSQRLAQVGNTISPWGYLLPETAHS